MKQLVPCSACHRHVEVGTSCPFCGGEPEARAPRVMPAARLSRAAVFASATLAGCWGNGNEPRTTPVEHHDTGTQTANQPPPVKTATAPSIEGTLSERGSGQLLANVRITISGPNNYRTDVFTDARGHYIVDKLEPGPYVLSWIESGGRRPFPRELRITVVAGQRVVQDLDISPPFNNPTNIPMPYGAPPARRRVV